MAKLSFTSPDLSALTRGGFVADMHFHTRHSHDCETPVTEIVRRARQLGIHVALTDHNVIGGVLEARRFKDAPVIPGIELCTREGKEVIAYFSDGGRLEEFFDRHVRPRLKEKNSLRSSRTPLRMEELLPLLRDEECLVHLPHPFGPHPRRSYNYFRRREHLLSCVDSIEIFNPNVVRRGNLCALGWAEQAGKGVGGGSDGHLLKWLGHAVTVSKASTPEEHLKLMAKGRVEVYGVEMKPHERALNYAATSVRTKLTRGVTGGIRKGLSFPRRAIERL